MGGKFETEMTQDSPSTVARGSRMMRKILLATVAGAGFGVLVGVHSPNESKQCRPTSVTACSEDELLFLLSTAGAMRIYSVVDPQGVRAEAGLRIGTQKLLKVFRASRDDLQQEAIVRILSERQEEEISRTFASMLSDRVDAVSCWMAAYLAHRGDHRALRILNDHYWEWSVPVGSRHWNTILYVFGEQHYYEASDNLIDSLGAASGNLSNAALEALLRMYPDSKLVGILVSTASSRHRHISKPWQARIVSGFIFVREA